MTYQNSPSEKLKFKPHSSRLMDQVREVLQYHHYSIRTEQSYIKWILAFIRFNGKRHPKELGRSEIEGFLSDMAVNKNYAASTQSLALNAIVFLYKQVLDLPIADDLAPIRSKKAVRLPVVLSQSEVTQLLTAMSGVSALIAKLM
ncbi:MAG: phage integrase N-terminal SAM-like domain-containing protein [Gammaproteobacteria bacterium]|nr:phage integrase N-terminal SAM-like domain-containing protein [Gammaproteobacteria bacterium]